VLKSGDESKVLQRAGRLRTVVMHLTDLIHSRVWVVLVALAILSFRIAWFVSLSRGSRKNRLDSMNSTDSWIERPVLGFWEIG